MIVLLGICSVISRLDFSGVDTSPGPKRIPFPSLTTSTDVNADLASTTTVIMTQTDTSIITQIVSSENSATLGSGVFMFAAYIAWRLLKKLKLRKKLPKVGTWWRNN
ncbi:hypothetical protein PLEOSDRAFT_1082666 [Pleurotus ostreatus PC15]|uniref:Uncharacterized protein n=1 Tax=Pleurotus ostreatus (strain PC15) TaxID=1137138 RepID=A0A067NYE4_PLEO1|nr:hypothetical protein PLEOSDRAFT_1082666 [Pleurotus ostreatus PC15]